MRLLSPINNNDELLTCKTSAAKAAKQIPKQILKKEPINHPSVKGISTYNNFVNPLL